MAENPGTESVVDALLKYVSDGRYVIPYFQRGFEWSASMICEAKTLDVQSRETGVKGKDRGSARQKRLAPQPPRDYHLTGLGATCGMTTGRGR